MRSFIPNPGFIAELEVDEDTVAVFTEAAERVADGANELRHRFYREEGAVRVVDASTRVNLDVSVVNMDPGGHMDEWGSVNNPAFYPLRRGVEAAGFEFKSEPKP